MRFGEMLAEVNGLRKKGFKRWYFAKGMSFLDAGQWWGRQGRRGTPHEGVDFLFYETRAGGRAELSAGTLVPAALDGEVAAVHGDFLGLTVWLRHTIANAPARSLYSVYGHLSTELLVAVGAQVQAGAIIGSVADPCLAGKKIAPHLHLSAVLVRSAIAPLALDWSLVQKPELAELVDPHSLHEFGGES